MKLKEKEFIKQGMRDVNGLKKIINSYIENETINANYVKNGSLEGYNSNKNIYSGEVLQKASKSTEDLEILWENLATKTHIAF